MRRASRYRHLDGKEKRSRRRLRLERRGWREEAAEQACDLAREESEHASRINAGWR